VFSNADDQSKKFYKNADGSDFSLENFIGDSDYIHTCDHPQYSNDEKSYLKEHKKEKNKSCKRGTILVRPNCYLE
jgi:hypothetical protein